MTHHARSSGFTLVELSIVLVIIGLIIGGVLTGQDLVKAATLRSAVADLEKYNAAATTFNGKYNGLPGDLTHLRAVEFNFSGAADTNATGATGFRDGNGVIEGGAAGSTRLVGEIGLFWQDLGTAGLIGGSYTATGTSAATGINVTAATLNTYLPRTRLRETVAHFIYADAGRNFYYLAAFTTDGTANVTPANSVTPLEAKGIDEKMDDGAPTTGNAINMTDLTTADPGAPAATTVCVTDAIPPVYNVSSSPTTGAENGQVCQLRIRAAF